MLVNMAISAGIGLVPVVGDISIAVFKTNSRNAALLEEYLRIRGEEYLKAERERIQDQEEIRPGHGKKAGEKVDGEDSVPRKRTSLFQRISQKGTSKEAGKPAPGEAIIEEDTPAGGPSSSKV